MKRKSMMCLLLIVFVFFTCFFIYLNSKTKSNNFVKNLKGTIYFIKRDEEISKLYKSDANLRNEKLIYSHIGKGKTKYNENNDNIMDFRYYPDKKIIEFEAMYNNWSIFNLKDTEKEPKYIKIAKEVKILKDYSVVNVDVDYLKLKNDKIEVYEKKGSMYLKQNKKEKCIKRFIGLYSEKFTGYRPIGLSPKGDCLIYSTTGSITGLGAILGINKYKTYIMDLKTLNSEEYVNSYKIQWIE